MQTFATNEKQSRKPCVARCDALFSFLTPYTWIVVALILLHLIPLWFFTYFPSQDGPSHLYNALVLTKYFDTSFPFHDFFSLRLTLFPNWLSHAILTLLMQIFSPLIADKIMLSTYVICFPLAFFYFLNAIRPGRHPVGLIIFAFIYNYLLFMGFYNFVFSIPLTFAALGYWWKYHEHLTCRRIVVINIFCTVLFFCHLMTYVIALVMMILITGTGVGAYRVDDAPRHIWIPRYVRYVLRSVACLVPTVPLLLHYIHKSTISSGAEGVLASVQNTSSGHVAQILQELSSMSILKNYEGPQALIARLIGLFILFLLVITTGKRFKHWRQRLASAVVTEDLFFIAGLATLVMYFFVPFSAGFYGWLNDRLLLVASLLLLSWVDAVQGDSGKSACVSSGNVVLTCCSLVLLNLLFTGMGILNANNVLKEFVQPMPVMAPKKVVLPLFFGDQSDKVQRSGFLAHASNYFTIHTNGINLDNYESQFDYFPVTFKPGLAFGAINDPDWITYVESEPGRLRLCSYTKYLDYLLVWNEPDQDTSDQISRCYAPVSASGRHKIYVPKVQE